MVCSHHLRERYALMTCVNGRWVTIRLRCLCSRGSKRFVTPQSEQFAEPGSDTVTAITTVVGAQPFTRFEQAIASLLAAEE
jgi:hypothetical protein